MLAFAFCGFDRQRLPASFRCKAYRKQAGGVCAATLTGIELSVRVVLPSGQGYSLGLA